jgi:hypothetical protein
MKHGWIGVDLDGTLAFHGEWLGHTHIGEPVPLMLDKVKKWLSEGTEVRIVTARVASTSAGREDARTAIKQWCKKHIGDELEVTSEKDYGMLELWDDRSVPVEFNTGRNMLESMQDADI